MSAVVLKALWMYGLMAVVSMLIAAVIKLIVVLLNVLERKPAAVPAPAPVPMPAPSWVAAAKAQDIAAEHLAAIGAAVYAIVGAHRIVHIDAAREGGGWSAEGRLAHHASHAMPTHPTKR
jgi:hypothetical protein